MFRQFKADNLKSRQFKVGNSAALALGQGLRLGLGLGLGFELGLELQLWFEFPKLPTLNCRVFEFPTLNCRKTSARRETDFGRPPTEFLVGGGTAKFKDYCLPLPCPLHAFTAVRLDQLEYPILHYSSCRKR